jgi:group I intron endonuclease
MCIEFFGNPDNLKKSGVYAIINLKNNKKYIGSTKCFKNRLNEHNRMLKAKKHQNKYLQNAFTKNQSKDFLFEIIEISDDYLNLEQRYLDNIFSCTNIKKKYYNISCKAICPPNNLGKKLTKEHKLKIGAAQKGVLSSNFGKKHSNEIRLKMSISKLNKKHTMETKNKISTSNLGKIKSLESKKKISESKKGKKLSDCSKRNIGLGKLGVKHPSYTQDICAENILTGEVIKAHNSVELSKLISASQSAIQIRINKKSKRYTEKNIFGIWRIFKSK